MYARESKKSLSKCFECQSFYASRSLCRTSPIESRNADTNFMNQTRTFHSRLKFQPIEECDQVSCIYKCAHQRIGWLAKAGSGHGTGTSYLEHRRHVPTPRNRAVPQVPHTSEQLTHGGKQGKLTDDTNNGRKEENLCIPMRGFTQHDGLLNDCVKVTSKG